MAISEWSHRDEYHPIDMVETLASHHEWEFDRVTEDQIAMEVEGHWRDYALTLSWSAPDETLRLIVTFELAPSDARLPALYDLINRCNDLVWTGAFTWWGEQGLMVWRHGLCLAGGQSASPEQVEQLIATALGAAERFYPAFQLVLWGGESPEAAMKVAIAEVRGHA